MTDPATLMRFVLGLRQEGVTHARVLSAMERTPRALYVPSHLEGLAFEDVALPLANGVSMTKPSIIGRMLAALDPAPGELVLEIGMGSGYQSAVLAQIVGKVVTLERDRELVADARQRFGRARLMNVFAHVADGFDGWPDSAPYDRIIVNAALNDIPETLVSQLKPNGVLVAVVNGRLARLRGGERADLGPLQLPPLERSLSGV